MNEWINIMKKCITKQCLICKKDFSVPHDQGWKFLCPEHTEEFYLPLRKHHTFPTIYNIIDTAVFLDDIETLRKIIKEQESAIIKFKEEIRNMTNTEIFMKKTREQAVKL
jgi:hypothetical protein